MRKRLFMAAIIVIGVSLPLNNVCADSAKIIARQTEGEVTFLREGKERFVELETSFEDEDLIRTGQNSQVDVVWDGKWGFRLLEKGECVFRDTDKKDTVLEMKDGNIIFNIEELPKSSRLRVVTPTAVAAVRGTQFWGQVRPLGKNAGVTFAVRRGLVSITVKETGDTFMVPAGSALDIVKGRAPKDMRLAKASEMAAMSQADEIEVLTVDVGSVLKRLMAGTDTHVPDTLGADMHALKPPTPDTLVPTLSREGEEKS